LLYVQINVFREIIILSHIKGPVLARAQDLFCFLSDVQLLQNTVDDYGIMPLYKQFRKGETNMRKAKRSIFGVISTLLVLITLFMLAGCDEPNGGDITDDYIVDSTPMSCTIVFDEKFMEIAGVTPEEWLGYLEENSDGRPGYVGYDTYQGEKTDDVVIVLMEEYGLDEWEELGSSNLQAVCQEFSALDEECIIELYENNTIADVWYNDDISRETAENYVAQLRKWCAYLRAFDNYEFGQLEQVNYFSTTPTAQSAVDERNYGISFQKVICTYAAFDTEKNLPIIEYTVYSDGTVGVKIEHTDGGVKETEGFTITEEQVQTIIDALRCYKVWTVGRCDGSAYGTYETLLFYDSLGFEKDYCGGFEPTSERFNAVADLISGILTEEHPIPIRPCSGSDSDS